MNAVRSGETFPQMIDRIRTRYSLQYHVPENAKPGFRHIRVELSAVRPFAASPCGSRARKGYFFAG